MTEERTLTDQEQDLIQELQEQGNNLGQALEHLKNNMPGIDQRALAIAATNFQTAQMWLIRAIAKPNHF